MAFKNYTTGYQCPDTGEWVVARYAFGKVTITPADDAMMSETYAYCQRFTNKRCGSLVAADDYIADVSDKQTHGFECYV